SFKIVSESGVAAGVRRIEAVTGEGALLRFREADERLAEAAAALKTSPENVSKQLAATLNNVKEMSREIERLRAKLAGSRIDEFLDKKERINGADVIFARVDEADAGALRGLCDKVKDKIGSGAVVLIGGGDKLTMLAAATDDIVKAGFNAGTVVKEAVAELGGRGGGKPNMAMAGGNDPTKIPQAFQAARAAISRLLTRC
ncbi:MAG: alanine--tRNA ligase, partial [Clostridiales bacterium]|nr:alanine--tRNA ligase [Clostridiales bacterium]